MQLHQRSFVVNIKSFVNHIIPKSYNTAFDNTLYSLFLNKKKTFSLMLSLYENRLKSLLMRGNGLRRLGFIPSAMHKTTKQYRLKRIRIRCRWWIRFKSLPKITLISTNNTNNPIKYYSSQLDARSS